MLDELGTAMPLTARGDGVFEAIVPEGWRQGRGTFGGLVLGGMAHAGERSEPDAARRLRTVDATLGAPLLPGPATIRVAERRRGRAMSTWSAQCTQAGVVTAELLGVFGLARPATVAEGLLLPPSPLPWSRVPVVPVEPPLAPECASHFEFRNLGAAPFSGQRHAAAAGWIRPRVHRRRHDAFELIALSDAWWPAALAAEREPRPMSTVSFQWSLFHLPTEDAPLYHEGRVLAADEGYFNEERILWDANGTLVAVNHQTIAVG